MFHLVKKNSMESPTRTVDEDKELLLPLLYFFGRIILFLGLIPNDLYGAGDLPTYFRWAGLKGWPFFNYWVEYPPVFPFLNAGIFKLSSGQEFLYDFILLMLVSLMGAGCIYIFLKIAVRLFGERGGWLRTMLYFGILMPLPYTWWYYEPLPIFLILLGVDWMQKKDDVKAGLAIGLGILTKWFPILLFPAVWRCAPPRRAWKVIGVALGVTLLVVGSLYALSPQMTGASLLSQPGRSSWETIWALIDGNYHTGDSFLLADRFNPAAINSVHGNPARVSPLLTLGIFGVVGLWYLFKVKSKNDVSFIAINGITWALFFLWSPGWSPQWILYMIPLILLSLQIERALIWISLLTFVTLLEWPLVLTHHFYLGMWVIVPARMAIFVALIAQWYRLTRTEIDAEPVYQSGLGVDAGD